MPELPEVETVRRGLAPIMVGARIEQVEQRRANLRFPFPDGFCSRLQGRAIAALTRRAKYLLAELDNDHLLVMHLGMSGSFRVIEDGATRTPGLFAHARGENRAHDHVAFALSNGKRVIYNDPRRFGFMLLMPRGELETHRLFANIGMEPLGNALNGPSLAAAMTGRRTPLKAALLDQSIIAGLGNIYVCEALHRAGLSPLQPAGLLAGRGRAAREQAERLAASIRAVLAEAIEAGGSSLRDHRLTDGSLGYFQHTFRVYGREGEACRTPSCEGVVERVTQAGRSTFHCPRCQKWRRPRA